jgi:hypothetical protein
MRYNTYKRKNRKTRKQNGGMCPCVYESMKFKEKHKQQNAKQQNGGVVGALLTQFNNAAALLTPIGAAFGIKAYRSWKKGSRKTRRKY